ncbi:MAG TPA: DUF998 domain-containing protein [Chryseosolibacter sp.]
METVTIGYGKKDMPAPQEVAQRKWQRVTLLGVLGYEAAGSLLGGSLLVVAPDGRLMDMPVDIMHGAFPDFLIPGIILFGLGILNTAAFISVLRRTRFDWLISCLALGGLAIWFWVEIAILLDLHWLHLMWGLPVLLGGVVAMPLIPSRYIQEALLFCGIISSLLYVAVNIIVPMYWDSYDVASQTVSELSAIGAPTRELWTVLCTPYTFLMIAFAWGVWISSKQNRNMRIAGGLLLAYGAVGLFWPFAPMHLRESLASGGGTFSDTMHIALGAVTEVIFLLALGFAAVALGKPFRYYSIATFVVLLVFGVLTFLDAPGIAANQPTPLIGIWERINIGVFLLWVVVLAIILLKKDRGIRLAEA